MFKDISLSVTRSRHLCDMKLRDLYYNIVDILFQSELLRFPETDTNCVLLKHLIHFSYTVEEKHSFKVKKQKITSAKLTYLKLFSPYQNFKYLFLKKTMVVLLNAQFNFLFTNSLKMK